MNFRVDLLKDLVDNEYEVIALGPDYDENIKDVLNKHNINFRTYYLQRTGFNPFNDLKTVQCLRKIYQEEKPDYILPYTVKPVIYSNIAKLGTNIKSLNWITGLGFFGLESISFKDRISKFIMTQLYKIGFQKNDIIVFQNNDDIEFFKEKGILRKNRYTITPGSGINLEKYAVSQPRIDIVKFIFVGRLIEAKGIRIFIEAAEKLKSNFNNIEFVVAGGLDEENPYAIQKEEIDSLMSKGIVNYVGHVNNVLDYVKESSVFVLPSMYREGVPRSILEALSLGRAIITTDNVGCRETIEKDFNGILVKPNNVSDLVNAMTVFIEDRNKILEFGANSRQLAERKFDVNIVNKIMLDSLKEL